MLHTSKFGLGEICQYGGTPEGCSRQTHDVLVKVIQVNFGIDGTTSYTIEFANDFGMHRITVAECQLTGDPDFDQVTGYGDA